jgi:hypothetical protein
MSNGEHQLKLLARRAAYKHDPRKSKRLVAALRNHERNSAAYLCIRAVTPTVAESKVIKQLYKDSLRALFLEIRYWKNGIDR